MRPWREAFGFAAWFLQSDSFDAVLGS